MFLFFPFDHKRGLRNQASGSAVAAKQATTLERSVIQTAKRSKMRSSSSSSAREFFRARTLPSAPLLHQYKHGYSRSLAPGCQRRATAHPLDPSLLSARVALRVDGALVVRGRLPHWIGCAFGLLHGTKCRMDSDCSVAGSSSSVMSWGGQKRQREEGGCGVWTVDAGGTLALLCDVRRRCHVLARNAGDGQKQGATRMTCAASPSVWRSAKRGVCELPTGRRSQINWAEPVFGSPHGKSINYNYQ
ncbi:hypothetical protein IWZ01DRAFT_181689 [Phyllosticta capitalensis]